MSAQERPRVLLVSGAPRRREGLHNALVGDGYDVVATCSGPDGDRHCPGMSHGSCGLTIGVDLVVLDVAATNGVGVLQAFYASRGLPVLACGSV